MAGEAEFAIGARVSCSDGVCGELRRMIVDPATDTVTHLVVEPRHQHVAGRLVPIHLADTTGGGIRLRCTMAEFGRLDHAEERHFADEADQYAGSGGLDDDGMTYGAGGEAPTAAFVRVGMEAPRGAQLRMVTRDVVPVGEGPVH